MDTTLNHNTYYKLFYDKNYKQTANIEYAIICTDDTDVYEVSCKHKSDILPIVYQIKHKRDSITLFNNYITKYNCTLQKITKDSIFGNINTIKTNTYYKMFSKQDNIYDIPNSIGYYIIQTDDTWVYKILYTLNDKVITHYKDRTQRQYKWKSITDCIKFVNMYNYKIEEISKEDLFLELL